MNSAVSALLRWLLRLDFTRDLTQNEVGEILHCDLAKSVSNCVEDTTIDASKYPNLFISLLSNDKFALSPWCLVHRHATLALLT